MSLSGAYVATRAAPWLLRIAPFLAAGLGGLWLGQRTTPTGTTWNLAPGSTVNTTPENTGSGSGGGFFGLEGLIDKIVPLALIMTLLPALTRLIPTTQKTQ